MENTTKKTDNTDKAIIAGTALTLSVLGLSLYEVVKHDALQHEYVAEQILEEQRKAQAESRPVTPEETARMLITHLGSQEELHRRGAVAQLDEIVTSPKVLEDDTREALAEALVRAFAAASDDEGREEIGRFLIGKVGGPQAAQFAIEQLGSSSETARSYVAQSLISGATRGVPVRDKVFEVMKAGGFRDQDKPALFRRYMGKKAEPELLAMLDAELSPKALKAVIIEVQNLEKPELMGAVLARIEQAGWLSDAQRMPWLSGKLLSKHIETASKGELIRAVAAVKLKPALAKATSKALRQRQNDQDVEIHDLVASVKLEEDPVVTDAPSSAEQPVQQQ